MGTKDLEHYHYPEIHPHVNFVILDAQRWADVFSTTLKRKVYIKGDLYC